MYKDSDNVNRKGFTLIELLAVIVILVGISLTAVMGISASLEKRDDKEYDEQIQLARNAAKIYFSLGDSKENDCQNIVDKIFSSVVNSEENEKLKKKSKYVSISELIKNNYFSSESKVDKIRYEDGCVIYYPPEYDLTYYYINKEDDLLCYYDFDEEKSYYFNLDTTSESEKEECV